MPLADYDVIREIHRDQLAVSRLARERATGRIVVLTSVAADPATVARLRAELETVSGLGHPSIAEVRDLFEEGGRTHVVTEWIEGRSLRELLFELSPLEAARVVEDLLAVAGATAEAGIAHLELKPENVLITAEGRAKVAGFGMASAWPPPRPSATGAGGVRDVAYIAPEQVLLADVGPAADLYAIGCMAYELLIGRPPFQAESTLELAMRHVDAPAPDPREADPSIPAPVAAWVTRMTAKAPADRFADAGAARAALEQALAAVDAPEPAGEDDAGALLAGLRHGARAGVAVRHVSGTAVAPPPQAAPPAEPAPIVRPAPPPQPAG